MLPGHRGVPGVPHGQGIYGMVPSISVFCSLVTGLSHENGISLIQVGKLRQGVENTPVCFPLWMGEGSGNLQNPPLCSSFLQCQGPILFQMFHCVSLEEVGLMEKSSPTSIVLL